MRRAGLRVPGTETYGNGTIRACGKTLRMFGWHVSVYRQTDGGASPAAFESPEGTRVAVWQAGIGGLDWLIELVKAGKAINLGGDGYPVRKGFYPECSGPISPQGHTGRDPGSLHLL